MQFSVGTIVFLTLLCMSLGAFALGFVSIYGIQSFRQEFDRLVETDLPQATIATRLNAEISGLNSQVGVLTSANSEIALGTIRIQIGDQLEAIDRLKEQLRVFKLRPGEYTEIDNTLNKLTSNLEVLTNLTIRRIRAEKTFARLRDEASQFAAPTNSRLEYFLWLQDLTNANRLSEIEKLVLKLSEIQFELADSQAPILGSKMLDLRRNILTDDATISGHLNHHRQLTSQLADATRFMSSRLISGANQRSNAILQLIQTNSYLILVCFLVFAAIGAFIYVFLDKQVVGRIQKLTQRINAYEGHGNSTISNQSKNEIITIEASFTKLTETIAERESRLVAFSDAAIEARRDAEKANRSKSVLLAAASHDLRQPIHAMGLLISGIARDPLDASSRQTLDHLANLTRETGELFNSILDMSKLEAGTYTAIQEPVDVAELFARVQMEFSQRAKIAGAKFKVRKPNQEIYVLGDGEALYRIIGNLLINAIEYTDQGTIELSGEIHKDQIIFTITDDGPGLDVGTSERSKSSPEDESGGYGLGLAISFALAKAMNTELTFSTPKSGGTQFFLPLKIATQEKHKLEVVPSHQVQIPSLKGLSVILLEDSADVNVATKYGLMNLGCVVTACQNLEAAQKALTATDHPVLLVTDLDLGRGQSAASFIQNCLDNAPQLIGVVVTTASPSTSPGNWRGQRCVQILEKPFSISRLASLIRYINLKQ
jgi:signal transduction histidine kinase